MTQFMHHPKNLQPKLNPAFQHAYRYRMSINSQITLYDILTSFLAGGPKKSPPNPDETHRYYLCKDDPNMGRLCMRVKYNHVATALQEDQQRMWVKQGCPAFRPVRN